jgi:hypothetical protein
VKTPGKILERGNLRFVKYTYFRLGNLWHLLSPFLELQSSHESSRTPLLSPKKKKSQHSPVASTLVREGFNNKTCQLNLQLHS